MLLYRDWITGAADNYGLTLQNYSGASSADYLIFSSSEGDDPPLLNITFCEQPSGPFISTSGELTAFSSSPGVASEAQTYQVAGSDLLDDIELTAPAGFELSTDGIIYSTTLTLEQDAGVVDETTIYVRLYSVSEGSFSGNIVHTSTDATEVNVAVSGTVLPIYTLTIISADGSVTLDPAGGSYFSGTEVMLTAVAASGYTFSSWSGGLTGSDNPATITMDGDKTVTANYIIQNEVTVTFQAGVSEYTGVDDVFIRGSTAGATNFSSETVLEWDENSGSTTDEFTLIRFANLFNSEGGPIPDGAVISSATLSYMTTDLSSGSTAEGDPANVYEVLVSWTGSTVTYNNFGEDAGVQSDEYRASPVVSASADEKSTVYSIDVTESVQRWSDSPEENLGWIFYPTDSDGVTIYSSEYATVEYRPSLSVEYLTGSVTRYTLTVGNDGHGTVTLNPVGGQYNEGTTVTLTPVPDSDYAFSAWSGASAFDLVYNGDGTWFITMDDDKTVVANFTEIPVNHAPNQPVLIQPADAATGISTAPTLAVTVSDDDSTDTLDVGFYGRVKGETSSIGEDFTLVVFPDTQNASQYYPEVFTSMTQWVVDEQDVENIVFVTHVGDIVNTANSESQWTNADNSMSLLDVAGVPYSVGPGNHDLPLYTGTSLYNDFFGISRFSGQPWYGGYYGSDNYNNYSLFSASGMDFILINLQYSATSNHLDWADGLLKANPTRRGIVVQHNILNTDTYVAKPGNLYCSKRQS